jgi:hypothetical protein
MFTFGLGPAARLSWARTRADVPRVPASASAWGNFPGRFRGIQRMAPHRLHQTRQARQSCRRPTPTAPPCPASPKPHKPRPASPRDSMNGTLYPKEWVESDIHRIPRPSTLAWVGPVWGECGGLGGAGAGGPRHGTASSRAVNARDVRLHARARITRHFAHRDRGSAAPRPDRNGGSSYNYVPYYVPRNCVRGLRRASWPRLTCGRE